MFNKISSLFIALTLAAVVNADFYLGTLTTTVFQGGNLDIRYSTVECNVNDCKGQYTRYAKIGDNMCGNNHVWKRGCSGNDVMGLGGRCGSGDWSKNVSELQIEVRVYTEPTVHLLLEWRLLL
jgi:hypothetical protein